jgi:hypothetical protein
LFFVLGEKLKRKEKKRKEKKRSRQATMCSCP